MKNEKIYNMPFGKVYGLLINKALRKNRTQKEVIELTSWLLGYSEEEITNLTIVVSSSFVYVPTSLESIKSVNTCLK